MMTATSRMSMSEVTVSRGQAAVNCVTRASFRRGPPLEELLFIVIQDSGNTAEGSYGEGKITLRPNGRSALPPACLRRPPGLADSSCGPPSPLCRCKHRRDPGHGEKV